MERVAWELLENVKTKDVTNVCIRRRQGAFLDVVHHETVIDVCTLAHCGTDESDRNRRDCAVQVAVVPSQMRANCTGVFISKKQMREGWGT